NDFYIKPKAAALTHLESNLDSFSTRKDLFVINSGYNPAPMYFAHRRGWVASNDQILDTTYLNKLEEKGARYVLILKKVYGTPISLPEKVVFENVDYAVYGIRRNSF
ncbi:MAG: hypothetical protein DRJ02_09125, partial [Bacteroidetes bacterium]